MEIIEKSESRLLDRVSIKVRFPDEAGKLKRRDAIERLAKEMNLESDKVALIRLNHQSGKRDVIGEFYIYRSSELMRRLHPRYLFTRILTKEEREKLKQEKKKAKAPEVK